ncbi:LSD1-like2 [Actinidia rufa]|uniref:LSD1-like2 n=1 Tax=Actinidia rufa TaxID=165716 RepID=A0A7J0GXC9_9ERIC|nr:LSD1-like2 [Actinidia rufa]
MGLEGKHEFMDDEGQNNGYPSFKWIGFKRSLRKKASVMNYDENLMDELIDNHVGRTLKKKNRTKKDLEKETKTEAMLALSLGFPIDALIEEEIKAGVVSILGGKEQNDYIVATEGSVIIVGAGLAGLAAARQLLSFGFKVVVLEGRNRPGGRVYTQKMGRNSQFAAVDLGGSVITGIHVNPLGVMARQLSIPLHKVRDNCPLYKPNGEPVDDPYEMGGGDHCFLAGGNWRLIKALSEGVPIFYGKTVHSIKYGNEGVEVVAGDQVFRADMVLCSVPLGVLIALVAGDAAQSFECTDPSTLLPHVLSILRGIYGPKAIVVPNPIQTICTRWGSDPLSYGSYSHVRVSSSGSDYDILAESVGSRLFFAATQGRHSNPWNCIPKHVVPSNDILVELFKKPDLVFGNFLFVFDSQTEDANLMGIMSISLGSSNSECSNGHSSKEERENSCHGSLNQTLQLYTMLSWGQAHELQLVTGGDQNRLSYLLKRLVLKLMGANAIGLFGSSLIANIATARRGRGRNRMPAGLQYAP